jgi:hypothetical protein
MTPAPGPTAPPPGPGTARGGGTTGHPTADDRPAGDGDTHAACGPPLEYRFHTPAAARRAGRGRFPMADDRPAGDSDTTRPRARLGGALARTVPPQAAGSVRPRLLRPEHATPRASVTHHFPIGDGRPQASAHHFPHGRRQARGSGYHRSPSETAGPTCPLPHQIATRDQAPGPSPATSPSETACRRHPVRGGPPVLDPPLPGGGQVSYATSPAGTRHAGGTYRRRPAGRPFRLGLGRGQVPDVRTPARCGAPGRPSCQATAGYGLGSRGPRPVPLDGPAKARGVTRRDDECSPPDLS